MLSTTCLARDDPARIYEYCPSIAAAILFATLFSLVTVTNITQSIQLRHRPAWVLIMAGLWEIGGYICRSASIQHQADTGIYMAQFLLILLAPLWVNAYVYMVFGRMVHFFMTNDRIFGVRARRVTLVFVLFDITAFVVQLAGGLMTSGTDIPATQVRLGLNIYTGGVALQLTFIAGFICLSLRFRQLLKLQDLSQSDESKIHDPEALCVPVDSETTITNLSSIGQNHQLMTKRTYGQARTLLRVVWLALSLIVLRNIFRLVEYGMGGAHGNVITQNEWFQYVFDAVPMFFVVVTLCVYHPGKVLQGSRSDFVEETKALKAEKAAEKAQKKESKRAKKDQKSNETVSMTELNDKTRVVTSETEQGNDVADRLL